MRRILSLLGVAAVVSTTMVLALDVSPAGAQCPPDSVESGTVCMDKYEASVWYVPPTLVLVGKGGGDKWTITHVIISCSTPHGLYGHFPRMTPPECHMRLFQELAHKRK